MINVGLWRFEKGGEWLWRVESFYRLRDIQQRREEDWIVFIQVRGKEKEKEF